MSRKDPRDEPPATTPGEGAYEVGYGRPPVASRFKKGRSGNPLGRPKKKSPQTVLERIEDEPVKCILLEEAHRMIVVRDGDKAVEMSVIQAAIRSLALASAKGNFRATKLLLESLTAIEAAEKADTARLVEVLIQYKLDGQKDIDQCEELGIEPPEMVPHPDDIHFDPRTGVLTVRGPMTEKEKKQMATRDKLRCQLVEEIEVLERKLSKRPGDKAISDEIRSRERIIERVDAIANPIWSPNARLVEG
ncbi:DUF5681 domain-containing protein [Parvibaculum sp.]|uniref:DUF5681 domain-containing protein n=1 Tax=Parvibaculum sp. TaxID=2024848 RepID=UPI0026070765|nr:DUF5681 domain-containing protein [Parvibaculum sp.]MCW5726947.1 hypothetical protein [Parvibaculum sp.]